MIKVELNGKVLELEAAEGLVCPYDAEADDCVWDIDLSYSDEVEQGIVRLIEMIRKEK